MNKHNLPAEDKISETNDAIVVQLKSAYFFHRDWDF